MSATPRKKGKVDREALNSVFMRVPRMRVEAARALLDLGYRELYELQGLSGDGLAQDWTRRGGQDSGKWLPYFRMVVYYAETPDPEANKLYPDYWQQAP